MKSDITSSSIEIHTWVKRYNKFNADDLIGSIQQKLWMWRWSNLTIIRRIQIVKTFIVPIFLYHAGWIPDE